MGLVIPILWHSFHVWRCFGMRDTGGARTSSFVDPYGRPYEFSWAPPFDYAPTSEADRERLNQTCINNLLQARISIGVLLLVVSGSVYVKQRLGIPWHVPVRQGI